MTSTVVPFFQLGEPYQILRPQLQEAIANVFEAGKFGERPFVAKFEEEFAAYYGRSFAAATASGTSAIHLALEALDIGYGDEVILPANGCFATAAAVKHAGATPVFIDCDHGHALDPNLLEKAISRSTKAIIVVHLYGQSANLNPIISIAGQHQLHLIEDCAQAHGCLYDGELAGTKGIISCFSFYPTKNLSAYGEAGAILTDDPSILNRIQALKNLGNNGNNVHHVVGYNYRMDALQAACLSVKLPQLEVYNKKRQEWATIYHQHFNDIDLIRLPKTIALREHVYHQFVIELPNRDYLQEHLLSNGIESLIHYPLPCHLQPAFAYLNYKSGDMPVSERVSKQCLSLPISEQHNKSQINYVAEVVTEYFKKYT